MTEDARIIDQGVLWSYLNPDLPLSLDRMIKLIGSWEGRSRGSIDDFWLRSETTGNELQACVAFRDRVALLYMVSAAPSPWLWSADASNKGRKVRVWDPGMAELDIPSEYFVPHSRAFPAIREFWESGSIANIAGWQEFNLDDIRAE